MTDKTIKKTGGDYPSVTAWEAAGNISTQSWVGIISDSTQYTESVTISVTGTGSSDNYVKLTTSTADRHSGVYTTSKASMRGTGSDNKILTVSEDWTWINWMQLHQDDTGGTSSEAVRVASGADNVLINYCVMKHDNDRADTDGVYLGNWSASVSMDNCIIYGFRRCCVNLQNYNGSGSQTLNMDHCTLYDGGVTGEPESGCLGSREQSSGTNTINVYNTACLDPQTGRAFEDQSLTPAFQGSAAIWTGAGNACTDTSLTDNGIATDAQESLTTVSTSSTSGSYFVVTSLTAGSENFLLLDNEAGNLAIGNGFDRIGSEPDPRQDFTVSIEGNTRTTTPDIGASFFVTESTSTGAADIEAGLVYGKLLSGGNLIGGTIIVC